VSLILEDLERLFQVAALKCSWLGWGTLRVELGLEWVWLFLFYVLSNPPPPQLDIIRLQAPCSVQF
jgi:hypothetical protein